MYILCGNTFHSYNYDSMYLLYFITPSTYFLSNPVISLPSLMKLDSPFIHESSRSNKLQRVYPISTLHSITLLINTLPYLKMTVIFLYDIKFSVIMFLVLNSVFAGVKSMVLMYAHREFVYMQDT